MKTLLPKLVKCRLIQAGGLLAVIAAVAASIAWSGGPEARVKLEGAWIAQVDNGTRALVTYGATDPSGQSSVFRGQMVWPLEMLASMGLDAVTDEVAEEFVTGKNTTQYTGIAYGLVGGRIALIFLDNTTSTYGSPTQRTNVHTLTLYPGPANPYSLPTADADNDGFPDPGTSPMMTFTSKSIGKRVVH
jgi:hypothetical protein